MSTSRPECSSLPMRFVFYQSHEDTGFVGEARIKRAVLMEEPMKFYEAFGDRVFLTKKELKEYVKSQKRWGRGSKKKKLWMAIELKTSGSMTSPSSQSDSCLLGQRFSNCGG